MNKGMNAKPRPSTPHVCTLPDVDRRRRETEYGRFLARHQAHLGGLTLRIALRGDPEALGARIEAIAAAERRCCAPLRIAFEATDDGGVVTLSGEGEAPAWTLTPLLDALR